MKKDLPTLIYEVKQAVFVSSGLHPNVIDLPLNLYYLFVWDLYDVKELNLDSMLIGVVKVQEYRPHGRKDDLPMEYGCNSEGKYCSLQMFGSTAASSIFVPVARAELQRQAHLINKDIPPGGMLDMATGSSDRYVYLGNKSRQFGVTVYANYEGSAVDTSKCVPIENGYSPEVCEITQSDGETQKRKIFTVKSSK